MPKIPLRLALIAMVFLVLFGYAAWDVGQGSVLAPAPDPGYSRFTVNEKTFVFTAVARTQAQLAKGLAATNVTEKTFMLFVFPRSDRWSFWMYGTNSSLTIIWVQTNGDVGEVVDVVDSAPTCGFVVVCATYKPEIPANLVIEARGGFASANGITRGTQISFS